MMWVAEYFLKMQLSLTQ